MSFLLRTLILLVTLTGVLGGTSYAGIPGATGWRATMSADGLIGTDAPTTLYPSEVNATLLFSYARNPLVWRYADNTIDPVIANQWVLNTMLTLGVWPLVDLGLGVPLLLNQSGPRSAELGSLSGSALGDLSLLVRVNFLPARVFGFGVAALSEWTLPTGNENLFMGETQVTWRPRLVGSLPVPIPWDIPHVGAVRAIASLGYELRKNAAVDRVMLADEIELHSGLEADLEVLDAPLTAIAEVATTTASAHPLKGKGLFNLEMMASVRTRVADYLVQGGAAAGLSQGIGTPAARVFVSISFDPELLDTDSDGLPDMADACPENAEDYDQYADLDGCPDFESGTLEATFDVLEPTDRDCKEDLTCIQLGEMNFDKDNDGILDINDACPDQPEDKDNFLDSDGCPELDNDHDGVVDDRDTCPQWQESINGFEDDDGCPDQGEAQTLYNVDESIELSQPVLFESGKAILKPESRPLLNQVALQILTHPEIRKLRIEGHTDSSGPETDNLYLSQDRADAVRRYLIEKNVAKDKLEAIGYGESRPIETNATPAGRTKNRRVEFVIIDSE